MVVKHIVQKIKTLNLCNYWGGGDAVTVNATMYSLPLSLQRVTDKVSEKSSLELLQTCEVCAIPILAF